jgi:hypothetical protein
MSRSDFDALIHEIGQLGELLLDVAFGPAAIDHEHLPWLPQFGDGDGWGSVAEALAPGDDEERPEAVDRPRTFEEGVSMPRASRTSAALAFERENSRSS